MAALTILSAIGGVVAVIVIAAGITKLIELASSKNANSKD